MTATARRYDNTTRRQKAESTRQRIVDSAVELMRSSPIRDWSDVTIRAVAEGAGVHERTVYRHFGTDKSLRDAVMAQMERAAGVDLDALEVDDIAAVAAKVLKFAASYPSRAQPPLDDTLHEADARRRVALLRAVSRRRSNSAEVDDAEVVRAAATIDLLWSLAAFERLQRGWNLDDAEATETIAWAIEAIVAKLDEAAP